MAILAVLGSAITLVSKAAVGSLSNVTVPGACLVALYCWYGVKLNMPLPVLSAIAWLPRDLRLSDVQGQSCNNDTDHNLPLYLTSVRLSSRFAGDRVSLVTPPVSADRLLCDFLESRHPQSHQCRRYLRHLGPSNIAVGRLKELEL
jgi:hypothetical protein